MQLLFIRHSLTAENLEHRYLGRRTDAPLCREGILLAQQQAPTLQSYQPDALFVSPLRRCRETASLLFPTLQQQVVPAFAECDFGLFEGKTYQELSGNAAYQAWIDSGGTLPFPQGESKAIFTARCCNGLQTLMQQPFLRAAVVVHGGTMMAVLSEYETQKIPYFSWKIPHCMPFLCDVVSKAPLRLHLHKEKEKDVRNL